MNLTLRILLGMAAGILFGILAQVLSGDPESGLYQFGIYGVIDLVGQIFVRSLQLMVVPLVFISLVCGASSLSDGSSMGRLGLKTVALYLLTTAIAVTVALSIALITIPDEIAVNHTADITYVAKEAPGLKQTLLNIFPKNPVAAMAEGKMLQIIVFAILFGVALAHSGERAKGVQRLFSDLNDVMMNLVTMLIKFAPYGVFCLMAKLFAEVGWTEITRLATYFFTVVAVLLLHVSIVYPTLLVTLARVNPLTFIKKVREPLLVAFSTASSGATMPVTLRTVEERVGVHNEIAAFAIPLGTTINMDGTAIMQGVATVFIASFVGHELVFNDYLMIILTATLASIGTAAVPGVGIIMLTMVLAQVGLPLDGIALILGVDRLLDMLRTAVNVTGDATVATIVAHSEGLLDRDVLEDPEAGRVVGDA